jgi:aquaporin NIP
MTASRPDLPRRAAAEALAAFALVFAGCGAVVTDVHSHGALGAVGVSLVFGLIIMVMVYATGHLSGAHINPAVTIAFTLSRHFPRRDAAAYVAAQLAGAAVAACSCSPSGPISRAISAPPYRPSAPAARSSTSWS